MRGKTSVEGFAIWLGSEAESFAGRAADLGRLVAVLREGEDLLLEHLPARVHSAASLRAA